VRRAGLRGLCLKWAETDVVLDRDGRARVTYQVRWRCSDADLHGFYFEGFLENPAFDHNGAYAVDQSGQRFPSK